MDPFPQKAKLEKNPRANRGTNPPKMNPFFSQLLSRRKTATLLLLFARFLPKFPSKCLQSFRLGNFGKIAQIFTCFR